MRKCPNCGGNLKYNIPAGRLLCESCGSFTDIEETGSSQAEQAQYERLVYVCKSCGASLTTSAEEATVVCPYCASQAVLYNNETAPAPAGVIPFRYTPEQIRGLYDAELSRHKFVPDDIKNAGDFDAFKGIYIPYAEYVYEADTPQRVFEAENNYTVGEYVHAEKYRINASFSGDVHGLFADMSQKFPDNVAVAVAPNSRAEIRPFNECYLAGFYADKETVFQPAYHERLRHDAADAIEAETKMLCGCTKIKTDEDKVGFYGIQLRRLNRFLVPVWFMSKRAGNRMIYAIANGRTGSLVTDIPVDRRKMFTAVGIGTLLLFAILTFASYFLSPLALLCCAFISMTLSMLLLSNQSKKIGITEDESPFFKGRASKGVSIAFVFYLAYCLSIVYGGFSIFSKGSDMRGCAFLMAYLAPLLAIKVFSAIKNAIKIKNSPVIVSGILSVCAAAFSIVIAFIRPVQDAWYIAGTLISLLVSVESAITTTNNMDFLTTHPLPSFFNRGEEQ